MNGIGSRTRRRRRADSGKNAMRAAAILGAVSLVAVAVGAGATAQAESPDQSAVRQLFGSTGRNSLLPAGSKNDNSLSVTVGKAVALSTDAAGTPLSNGVYTTTAVSGDGSTTVKVPVGTDNPVDYSSLASLKTEGQSIVYQVNNSGSQVQQLNAFGGAFHGELPVTLSVDLKVNGQKVDANSASPITGDVELNYVLTNKTNRVETIGYKDADGNIQKIKTNVPVPFTVNYDATFGNGWANLSAPWANSGFSTGQTITGSTTMMPSMLNKQSPNATLKITGRAENASLPSANISVIPKSTSGSVTAMVGGPVEKAGTELDQVLGKAVPLMLKVENGLGQAAGLTSKLLRSKVDPILQLLAKLHVDPKTIDADIQKGGKEVASLGDGLLSANALTEQVGAKLARILDDVASTKTEALLEKVIDDLNAVEKDLNRAIPLVDSVAKALAKYGPDISKTLDQLTEQISPGLTFQLVVQTIVKVEMKKKGIPMSMLPTVMQSLSALVLSSTGYAVICGGSSPCLGQQTLGTLLDSFALAKLATTCTSGAATQTLWNSSSGGVTYQSAMATAITKVTGATKTNLQRLQTLLNAQVLPPDTAACQAAGTDIENAINGLLDSLASVGNDLEDLEPLLTALSSGIVTVKAGLTKLKDGLPAVRYALSHPCGGGSVSSCGVIQGLTLVSRANAEGAAQLNQGIMDIVRAIDPVVGELAAIANGIGKAAPPIESTLNELPGLISQLAYGNIGALTTDAENLETLAVELTDESSKALAINKAIDTRFNSGDGFPYGSAEGKDTATTAVYVFQVAKAGQADAPTGTKVAFIVILLVLGGGFGTWLYSRNKAA